ncbi:MAG: HAD family hydrolase [Candidatus Omnitrophica bacterium]|nr:HAD family hydrolase [Candidatus Omnitrophota bacterium]
MKQLPRNPKLVIFDLDGTLVDAYHAITESINFMLKKIGYPVQCHRTVKRSVGWGVDSLVKCFVPENKAVEALAIFRAHHDNRLRQNIWLLSGARTLLPFLKKRGCLLAIASNRPTKFCHIILKALGIDHYFDFVICGDAVPRAKPYPDMIKVILKKSGIRPSEAVYVGDMSVDILCGQRAGVYAVGVPTGSCTRQELIAAKPDRMIKRLTQVRDFFDRGAVLKRRRI